MSETAPDPTPIPAPPADVDPASLPVAATAPEGQISGMAAPDDLTAV